MASNPNSKSVDTMLKELDGLFESHYLGCKERKEPKKPKEPYSEITNKLKPFKNADEKNDLLNAIKNKIDSKETFLKLETNIWNILFVIIGLFVTMISNLILSNYDKLDYFNEIPRHYYVICVMLIAPIFILLYCCSTYPARRKSKEKCYYKFVYNYLNQKNRYTIDDIYSLPEGSRAELIGGQIYYMAQPSTMHQRILSFLHLEIGNHIRAKGGTCEVLPAPFAVFLCADDSKYLEPDISVICDKDKLDDRGCKGAPDWILEIVSPSSRIMDYYTKLSLYLEAGVREYWIVDPVKQTILVYDMKQAAAPAIYSFSDIVKVNIYNDFEIDFSKLQF